MMKDPTEIGFIYADIAGDHRYTTKISVLVEGDECEVRAYDNGAVGGMDGPGGAYGYSLTTKLQCRATAKDVLKTVKGIINSSAGHTVKRYGKPSKRFSWIGVRERGLNAKFVTQALEVNRRREQDIEGAKGEEL